MRDGSPRVTTRNDVMGPRAAARRFAARIGSTPRRAALTAATVLAGVLLWTPAGAFAAPTVSTPALSPGSGLLATTDITFSTSASNFPCTQPIQYRWWLDADPTTDQPTHTVAAPSGRFARGTHTVAVQAHVDGDPEDLLCPADDSSVASRSFTVGNSDPSFAIAGPSSAKINSIVPFGVDGYTDADGDAPVSYLWDFDDPASGSDNTSHEAAPTHFFSKLDTYNVTLTINDGHGGVVQKLKKLTIGNQLPVISSFAASATQIKPGDTVHFEVQASDPDDDTLSYSWNFDDGQGGPDSPAADHVFARPDTYGVVVTVSDGVGGSRQAFTTITVRNDRPAAALSIGPNPASVGQVITYDASGSIDDQVLVATSYVWSVPGATCNPSTGPIIKCAYATAGPKVVSVQVTDEFGLADTEQREVTVSNKRLPVPDFVITPASPVAAGTLVTLVSTSQPGEGGITKTEWDLDGNGTFGDAVGSIATTTFTTPGSFKVAVRVTDASNEPTTLEKPIVVTAAPVVPPVAPPVTPQGPAVTPPRPTVLSALVRISGTIVGGGVKVSQLRITAPAGTKVKVLCKGKGCVLTKKALRLSVKRSRNLSRTFTATVPRKKGFVTFSSLKRKLYIGTTLEVYVTRPGTYGKFTRFTIRAKRSPLRRDACVDPANGKATVCPAV